ncbi:MAG: YitT family protein [Desulfovibrionaceae bacterium]
MSKSLHRRMRDHTFSVPWNLALITLGSALIGFAVKGIAQPQGLLTGGASGLGLFLYYVFGGLTTGQWFLIINVPIFVLGWVFVSRRFFFYSLYGMAAVTFFIEVIPWQVRLDDPWLAVFTCGATLGTGVGVALRSLGSTGGTDILAVILKQRYNLAIGKFKFFTDVSLFVVGFFVLDPERMLYSAAMIFVTSIAVDYSLNVFSERKLALIISDNPRAILADVLQKLDRGATLLHGQGGYSGQPKEVVLTMVNNIQLKRLEELVYASDPHAFLIIGSGFNVLGQGFSTRKIY